MPAVNITTTAAKAFEIPSGSWGYRMQNASDETIYTLDNAAVTVATGMPLAAGAERTVCFAERSRQPMSVQAIHAGSGDKSLRYEILTVQIQAASRTSPSGGAGSFGGLTGVPGDNAALAAALAAKLDQAGGTMTGALVINPTTGAPLTVRRNSKTCFEVTNGEQINIGRYDGVFGSGTENAIGWSGKYGSGSWIQGGAGNWYAAFQLGAGTGEFRIASDVGGTNAVRLFNASASSLQIGVNHATTPTEQTLKAHNVTTGTGAALKLCGGTGSVMGGSVKIAASATTGAPNTLIEVMPSDQLAFFGTGGSTQPNTGIAGELHVAGSGTAVTEDSTFGGYTLMQVVAGLRALGLFQ